MARTCALGVDLGTSSAKALLLSDSGEVLSSSDYRYPSFTPQSGVVEQLAEDWVKAVSQAARACVASAGEEVRVAAVAISGHMSSVVPVDARHQPLRRALTIGDARGAEEAAFLSDAFGAELRALSGNVPASAFALPKFLWLKRHEPDVIRRAKYLMGAKDYVRLRLIGRAATEPSEAGNWLLLDHLKRDWERDLAQGVGVPVGLLPEMRESLAIAGPLTAEGSELMGLPVGTPVAMGSADMAASLLGCGFGSLDEVAITMGTSGQITRLVREPAESLTGKMTFHPHLFPGETYVMASLFTGGLGLDWFASMLGGLLSLSSIDAVGASLEAAAHSPPGSRGVRFLPYLTGAGSPRFSPHATAAFLGLTRASSGGDLVRAVLEGVAYSIRENLELLDASLGPATTRLLAGGGFRAALWRDITVHALNEPLLVSRRSDVGPLGTAIAAGMAVNMFADGRLIARKVRGADSLEVTDLQAVEVYEAAYTDFRS